MQPLTHHEILGLVEPFTRRGRHVDLAASRRLERCLAFKAVEHGGGAPDAPVLTETLQLENPAPGSFRLLRTLTHAACGLDASLIAEGAKPEALLAWVEAVPVQRAFDAGPGFVIALNHRVEPASGDTDVPGSNLRLVLTTATVQCEGMTLEWRVMPVAGVPADLFLQPAGTHDLPEDLLAVLGRRWSLLHRRGDGWRGSLRLARREPERSRGAERALRLAAEQLAQTLAEPPRRFHERWLRARWGVTLRRAVPLLSCAALIGAAPAVAHLALAQTSVFRMLVFNGPPLLLVLLFSLRELPRFEIPPRPRPVQAGSWRTDATPPAAR